MTPAVDGGLAATATDHGVEAMTTTSRLRAAVVERVMAMVAGSGVAATKVTSHLLATTAEWAMALAFNHGVVAMAAEWAMALLLTVVWWPRWQMVGWRQRRPATATDEQWRRSVWWVFRGHPIGTPRALRYAQDG